MPVDGTDVCMVVGNWKVGIPVDMPNVCPDEEGCVTPLVVCPNENPPPDG